MGGGTTRAQRQYIGPDKRLHLTTVGVMNASLSQTTDFSAEVVDASATNNGVIYETEQKRVDGSPVTTIRGPANLKFLMKNLSGGTVSGASGRWNYYTTDLTSRLIDDFEDGDKNTKSDGWTKWKGDTDNLSAQTGTVLSGSVSGELKAVGEDVTVQIQPDSTYSSSVSFLLQVDTQKDKSDESGVRIITDPDVFNELILECTFRGDGVIYLLSQFDGFSAGFWTVGDVYRVSLFPRFSDEETRAVVQNQTTDTLVGSGVLTDDMVVDEIAALKVFNNTGSSGNTTNLYFDDVKEID